MNKIDKVSYYMSVGYFAISGFFVRNWTGNSSAAIAAFMFGLGIIFAIHATRGK